MRWSGSFLVVIVLGLLPGVTRPADPAADEKILQDAGVALDDAGLLRFFRTRTPNEEQIRALIRQLGDDSFEVREQASKELTALGPVAESYLREAIKSGDAEVVRRAEECLKNIGKGPSARVIAAAARLLTRRKPAGAAEVLLDYLPRVEGEATEAEVRLALAALAIRDGKPEPVLIQALADKVPGKRAAAAAALVQAGAREPLPAVRKLLQDPEPSVRLHAGLALAGLKEKEAIPVLIDLLPVLSPAQIYPIEDLLYRLADDKAPDVVAGTTAESRKKHHEAWRSWWQQEGGKIDLARLDEAKKFQGYTMVVLLDAGSILEVDSENKVRWRVNDLAFPLDAQLLPGERVLVAEFRGGRVTERTRKGEVIWQKLVQEPLVAQRLANGNTFIGTRYQLLEVDRNGKQLFSYMRPQGDQIMKAQKQPDGSIGLVTDAGLFVRLDREGKELSRFRVDVRTSGGRIDLLPGGRVLVPLKDQNRVVEYDAEGTVVWEASFPEPVAAVRLANGNTMITGYQSQRAVEVDRSGKTVYEYKTDARVTRAWRR
jgi:hypothetical protein